MSKEPKNPKFEEIMKWIGNSIERIHNERMTPENAESVSKNIKNRQVCIHDGRIFTSTLQEIEQNNYRLIEDVPISQWGLDLDHPDLKPHKRKIIEILKMLAGTNLYLEDDSNDFLKGDPFKIDWNMFDTKRHTKYYKHNDY
jgi:hypothetical protein